MKAIDNEPGIEKFPDWPKVRWTDWTKQDDVVYCRAFTHAKDQDWAGAINLSDSVMKTNPLHTQMSIVEAEKQKCLADMKQAIEKAESRE